MKKIISFISLIVIILLSLTGCMTVNYELTINEDGTGSVKYIYGVTKEAIESLGDNLKTMTEGMKSQAEAQGYATEPYSDDTIEGFAASKQLNDVTTELSMAEAFGESYVKDSEENKPKIDRGIFATKYSQTATIDLTSTSIAQAGSVGAVLKYSINLPTKAGKNNANEVSNDGKTLTWNLKAGEVNQIEFTASKISAVGTIAIVVAIIGVVAILAVIILVILKKAKKGKVATSSYIAPEEVLKPQTPSEEVTEVKEPKINESELKQEEPEVNQTETKEEEPMAPNLKALEEEPEEEKKEKKEE